MGGVMNAPLTGARTMADTQELETRVVKLENLITELTAQTQAAVAVGRFRHNRYRRFSSYDDRLLYDQLHNARMELTQVKQQLHWARIKADPHSNDEIPF